MDEHGQRNRWLDGWFTSDWPFKNTFCDVRYVTLPEGHVESPHVQHPAFRMEIMASQKRSNSALSSEKKRQGFKGMASSHWVSQ